MPCRSPTASASAIFFIGKSTLRCPSEQGEFLFQRRLPCFGQHTQQMLEQDMEPAAPPACAAGAVMADFRDGQADKIDPVRRPVAQVRRAGDGRRATWPASRLALADVHQESVNLIQCQHGGRRIVNARRQSLVGDVHHDAKRKTRVLFHRPLGTDGDTGTQSAGLDGTTAAVYAKQRIAPGQKSPTCGTNSITTSARSAIAIRSRWSNATTTPEIPRCATVEAWLSVRRRPAWLLFARMKWLGIDALHHGGSFFSHCLEHRNRPQRLTEPLYEPEETAMHTRLQTMANATGNCGVVSSIRPEAAMVYV